MTSTHQVTSMRVVLAGFGPFPGTPVNPSAVLVKALARRRRPALADIACISHIFATAYAAVDRDLPKLLGDAPDIVLMFGVATGRRQLCIETRARNALSLLHPDARGYSPPRGVIAPNGPTALRGTAPFWQLLGAARTRGFPVRLSRDAGRYLCNYTYWRALERTRNAGPLVLFVHIPAVALRPRRRRQQGAGGRRLSFSRLVATAELLLVALIAASRR
jgi:pyroglutamyl-peptidase